MHAHLARAYLAKGRHREALYEADSALIVQHPQPGYVHLLRARAFQGLGQRREAREAAEAARQADPELAEQAAEITGG